MGEVTPQAPKESWIDNPLVLLGIGAFGCFVISQLLKKDEREERPVNQPPPQAPSSVVVMPGQSLPQPRSLPSPSPQTVEKEKEEEKKKPHPRVTTQGRYQTGAKKGQFKKAGTAKPHKQG
jgi:hypothetical protein